MVGVRAPPPQASSDMITFLELPRKVGVLIYGAGTPICAEEAYLLVILHPH